MVAFWLARGFDLLGDSRIRVVGIVAHFIVRMALCARARIPCGKAFGEFRESLSRPQHGTEPPREDHRRRQRKHDCEEYRSSGWRAEVEQRRFTGLFSGAEGESENDEADHAVQQDQRPDCGTQSRFHTTLQISSAEPSPSIGVVSTNLKCSAPGKPRAAGANQSPAPGGRHAATFRCNPARFPALARASPRYSPSTFR